MNKNYFGLLHLGFFTAIFQLTLLLFSGLNTHAQTLDTITIGSGNQVSQTLFSPIQRFSATSSVRFNRGMTIYSEQELNAAGIQQWSMITSVAYDKAGNGGTIAGRELSFRMYMGTTGRMAPLPPMTMSQAIVGKTQVFFSSNMYVPDTSGWVIVHLDQPFIYMGGALEIATESTISGPSQPFASGPFDWKYTVGFENYAIGNFSLSGFSNTDMVADTNFDARPNTRFYVEQLSFTDAALLEFIKPNGTCDGTTDVVVLLENVGVDTITNIDLIWKLNGIEQDTVSWNGQLAWSDTVHVYLGSFNALVATPYDLEAHILGVGPATDTVTNNDTIALNDYYASVEGNFTINSNLPTGGTNFNSFNDFADIVNTYGVCGPVTVDVVAGSGPYNEPVVFEEFWGADSINTVVINGNGNLLTYGGQVPQSVTLVLDGTDYLTVNDLYIEYSVSRLLSATVQLKNGADYNVFSNCHISTFGNSQNNVLFASSEVPGASVLGRSGNYNTFQDNMIVGANNAAIRLLGFSATEMDIGNAFIGNEITGWNRYGVFASAQDGLFIYGNEIQRENATSNSLSISSISLQNGITNARIEKNILRDLVNPNTAAGTITASHISLGNTSTGVQSPQPNIISNNIMFPIDHMGQINFIFNNTGSNNTHIFHNTFLYNRGKQPTSITPNSMVFIVSSSTDIQIKNNAFHVIPFENEIFNFIRIQAQGTGFESDGNAFYSTKPLGPSVRLATTHSGIFESLPQWQASNNAMYDQNSVYADPFFNPNNQIAYLPHNPVYKSIGQNVNNIVPDDFNGVPRPPQPDPGAFQIDLPPGPDMTILRLFSLDSLCPGPADVIIEVMNYGTDTLQSITVNWTMDGVPQTPVVATGNFIPLVPFQVLLDTFNLSSNVYVEFTASVDSVFPGQDVDSLNNHMPPVSVRSLLSGTYTLNQQAPYSASNFTSFAQVKEALEYGICGPVTIDVVPGTGPYNEQVQFNSIPGASDSAEVVINGNGNVLSYQPVSQDLLFVLALNGTSYLTVDSLEIVLLSLNGVGVFLTNESAHNTIQNCTVEVEAANTLYNNIAGIVMGPNLNDPISEQNGSGVYYNRLIGNTIIGGVYGITVIGEGLNDVTYGNEIRNNLITNFLNYGIYISSQDSLVVDQNQITRGTRQVAGIQSFFGIHLVNAIVAIQISNNRIFGSCNNCASSNGNQNAINIISAGFKLQPATENRIYNNLIYDMNGVGAIGGIRQSSSNSDYWKIYHNTIAIEEPIAAAVGPVTGISLSGIGTNNEMFNNLIYFNRTGGNQQVGIANLNSQGIVDYNVVYIENPGPNKAIGRTGASNFHVSFSDWQAAGFDPNGFSVDPVFVDPSAGDYTPGAPALYQTGANLLSSVPEDINGVPRTTTPDIGAIQFFPLPCLGALQLRADSVFYNGALLSWTSTATLWEMEWGAPGFGLGSGSVFSPIDTNNFFAFLGFPPDSCIDIYIRELCGNDTSISVGPLTICTPKEHDAEMISVVAPDSVICGDSTIPIEVTVRNSGGVTINALPIHVEITGSLNQTIQYTHTAAILPHTEATFSVGTINLSNGGEIEIDARTILPNDQDPANDNVNGYFVKALSLEPDVDGTTDCTGDFYTMFPVRFHPFAAFKWFAGMNDTVPIYIGDTLLINNPSQTSFWVEYTPKQDSLATVFGSFSGQSGNMVDMFVNHGLRILSFDVTPLSSSSAAGFEIYYKQGSYQGSESVASDWTLLESYANVAVTQLVPHRLSLANSVLLNAGQTYSFYITRTDGNIRHRIPTANEYDVHISNAGLSIMEGISVSYPFGSVLRPRTWFGKVIFEYETCSGLRSEVPLASDSVPQASFNFTEVSHSVFFENTSSYTSSVQWDFGGLGTSTADTVTFQFPTTDSFEVCLFAFNDCGVDSVCQFVWAENISVAKHGLQMDLKLFPNPNHGQFTLEFYQEVVDDISIELADLNGKILWSKYLSNFSGSYDQIHSHTDLASGMYLLRLRRSDGVHIRKVIVN